MNKKSKKGIKRTNELKKLEKEVLDLEKKIIEIEKANKKLKNIRNLKIFGGIRKVSMPFIIMTGLTVSCLKVLDNGYPFVKDLKHKYKAYTLETKENGLVTCDSEYLSRMILLDSDRIKDLKIISYENNIDGTYSKIIREFKLKDDCFFEVKEAILNKDFSYIEDNFTVSNEEIITTNYENNQNGKVIEAKLQFADYSDCLTYEETDTNNKVVTVIELTLSLLVPTIITRKRQFQLKDYLEQVNEDFRPTPVQPIEDEIAIKKAKIMSLYKGGSNNVK